MSVLLFGGSWLSLVVMILPRRAGVPFLVGVFGGEWSSWQSAGLFILLHDLLDALVGPIPRLRQGLSLIVLP